MAEQQTDAEVLGQIHDQNMKNAIASQQSGFGQAYYFGSQAGVVLSLLAGVPQNLIMDGTAQELFLRPSEETPKLWDTTLNRLVQDSGGFYETQISFFIDTTVNNTTCIVELVDAIAGPIRATLVDLPRSSVREPHTLSFQNASIGNIVTVKLLGSVNMSIEDVVVSTALIMKPNPSIT